MAQPANGDVILDFYGTSFRTYQATAKTAIQDVRPLFDQRGVNLDGSLRAPSVLPIAMPGNAFGESWSASSQLNGVQLGTGAFSITDVDLSLPAPGFQWVIGRSYNPRQKDSSGSYFASNGYQGKNWFQLSQPEIVFYDDADNSKDMIYLVYGADRFIEFKRQNSSSNEFKAKNGAAGVMHFTAGATNEPDTYTHTDPNGNATWFFGFDGDAGTAAGQFWKFIDPAGNKAYAGDATTGSTAISSGYDSGKISKVYDSADRRFTYTYTAASPYRLLEVKAETKTGGTWASPTGVTEVGKVAYSFYSGADAHGQDGDLKLVQITTPMTDSGISV
ncbi:MAG: hypothetical protein L0Y44_06490, partial [Phycisphaerales bacterium]|nr:hypothetical protein [Phycisphaerales bacterium]